MRKDQIPEADMKLINDSFKQTGAVETLGKNGAGVLINAERKVVNPTTFEISDFRGRTLKHQKSLIPVGGSQVTVGVGGQLFEDIPVALRKQVVWFESDFV